jgi:hypothetical protein
MKAVFCFNLMSVLFLVPLVCDSEWADTDEMKSTDYIIVLDATASMYYLEIPITSDFLECEEKLIPESENQTEVQIKKVKRITLARISIHCWLKHENPRENDRFQLFFIQGNYLENVTSDFQPISKWDEYSERIKNEENRDISGPDKYETDLGAAFFEAFYYCIEKSPPDKRKVIIFASDLIESSSGQNLCKVIDDINDDHRSTDVTYLLFLAIAAREEDYKKVNQCFQEKFPRAIFVPIVTNQGVTFENYDTLVDILGQNEDLLSEIEKAEKELEETSREREECQNSIDKLEESSYRKIISSPLFAALSIILIVCAVGILLGIRLILLR